MQRILDVPRGHGSFATRRPFFELPNLLGSPHNSAITHGTLWKMSSLVKRLESKPWLFVFAFTWVYLLRVSLNGFYDGVWLLAGALGISAFAEKKFAQAAIAFTAALLISYRGVCLAPLGLAAVWSMLREPIPVARKVGVIAFGIAGTLAAVGAFYMLFKYGPVGDPEAKGVGSALLSMSFRSYVILGLGLGAAAFVARVSSPLVKAAIRPPERRVPGSAIASSCGAAPATSFSGSSSVPLAPQAEPGGP